MAQLSWQPKSGWCSDLIWTQSCRRETSSCALSDGGGSAHLQITLFCARPLEVGMRGGGRAMRAEAGLGSFQGAEGTEPASVLETGASEDKGACFIRVTKAIGATVRWSASWGGSPVMEVTARDQDTRP